MLTPEPRVYVVNHHDHDLSSLSTFSPLPPIILTEGHVVFNYATQKRVASKLVNFREDIDYIVPAGSSMLAMMVVAILAETFNSYNYKLLAYNKNLNTYSVKKLDGYVEELAREEL